MALVDIPLSIAPGQVLSPGVDCTSGPIVRLALPAGWAAAPLSFQVSTDGSSYSDWRDRDGREVTIPAAASACFLPPEGGWLPLGWLKCRSGTAANPTPQPAAGAITITLLVESAAERRRRLRDDLN